MKISWKDAPQWANYLAMDGDGDWYWYEQLPKKPSAGTTWGANGGKCSFVAKDGFGFLDSLQSRPTPSND